jgi:hypothetical protein
MTSSNTLHCPSSTGNVNLQAHKALPCGRMFYPKNSRSFVPPGSYIAALQEHPVTMSVCGAIVMMSLSIILALLVLEY